MLESRELWSTAPPEPRSRDTNWPTVLFSWWCTSFAAVIILTRLCGRKVRSDRLFREDWIMFISLIPLFIRMIFIHYVLIYGTNNVNTENHVYTEEELNHHSMGARLVLAARIFYAMFIWLSKLTISEFLKRITARVWRRSWELTLQGIRIFLFVTFGGVVLATLTECQPFDHYWQVVPDPGPHCRQGFAQLLTMGSCDIVTDILLIAFPIPVVLSSGQTWKRKLQMGSLFSLSIIMIGVTATRMPEVIRHHGRQQYRTVWASCEILASAAVSNGVILGSFLRDKGTKKNKFRTFSTSESVDFPSTRRPTLATLRTNDSDEDLFMSVGVRMPEHLQDKSAVAPRPAPPVPAPHQSRNQPESVGNKDLERNSDSDDSLQKPIHAQGIPLPSPSTTRSVSFFDVGNLLEDDERVAGSISTTNVDSGNPSVSAYDFAPLPSLTHVRSSSRTFLRDVGGMLSPNFVRRESRERNPSPHNQDTHRRSTGAPIGVLVPMLERQETQMSLQDPGGLLEAETKASRTATSSTRNRETHEEEIEMDDMDDGLDEYRRRRNRAAVSLQEILHRENVAGPARTPTRSPRSGQQTNFDDMVLNDPGGLL